MPRYADIAAIIAAVAALLASLTGLWAVIQGKRNEQKIQEVHLSLNSRLDEWKAETAAKIVAAHAQGRQDERDSQT